MTTTAPTSVFQIGRNDFEAARRYYEANKPIGADEYTVLARLQDDLDAFLEATIDWQVTQEEEAAI